MKESKRLQIIADLKAWAEYHEELAPMPLKPFTHSLLEVAVAVNTQCVLNEIAIKKKKLFDVHAVPNDAVCAAIVAAANMTGKAPTQVMKSFACANGNYVLLVCKKEEAEKFDYNPDQLDLQKEASKAEQLVDQIADGKKGKGTGRIILLDGGEA